MTGVGEHVETLMDCWWEHNAVPQLGDTGGQFLKMFPMGLLCDPAIPLLGLRPRELTAGPRTHAGTAPWTAALRTRADGQTQASAGGRADERHVLHPCNGMFSVTKR